MKRRRLHRRCLRKQQIPRANQFLSDWHIIVRVILLCSGDWCGGLRSHMQALESGVVVNELCRMSSEMYSAQAYKNIAVPLTRLHFMCGSYLMRIRMHMSLIHRMRPRKQQVEHPFLQGELIHAPRHLICLLSRLTNCSPAESPANLQTLGHPHVRFHVHNERGALETSQDWWPCSRHERFIRSRGDDQTRCGGSMTCL